LGVYPPCFCKSVEIVERTGLAGIQKSGVRKGCRLREIGEGLIRNCAKSVAAATGLAGRRATITYQYSTI
jgi:hypothetical protein